MDFNILVSLIKDKIIKFYDLLLDWISNVNTDFPIFILTVVLVFIGLLTLYIAWLRVKKGKDLKSHTGLMEISPVRRFDIGRVVGAFKAGGVTNYSPISKDTEISEILKSHNNLIVSGRPGIGKSHTVMHWIHQIFPRWYFILPSRQAISSIDKIYLKKKRYILLLDDLDKYTKASGQNRASDLLDFIFLIHSQVRELVVIATIRSTLSEVDHIAENLKEFYLWSRVELSDWTDEQGLELSRLTGVGLDKWDNTPLSVKSPSNEIIQRVSFLSPSAQSIAEMLKVLKNHGIFSVSIDVLHDICNSFLEFKNKEDFNNSLKELKQISLLKHGGLEVSAYDAYLDQIKILRVRDLNSEFLIDVLKKGSHIKELKLIAENALDYDRLNYAEKAAMSAIDICETDANAHYIMGRVYIRMKQFDKAEIHFYEAAKICPSWATCWVRLGTVYQKLGRIDESIFAMERAKSVNIKRSDEERLLSTARILNEEGRIEEALELYDLYIQISGNCLSIKGYLLNSLNRWNEAIVAFKEVLSCHPKSAFSHFGLAESLQNLGDLDTAEAEVRTALEIDPRLHDAWVTLIHIIKAQNRLPDAIKELREALKFFPNSLRILSYYGEILNRCRKFTEAEDVFRKVLDLDPEYSEVWVGIAMSYRVQGKIKEAIEANQKAISFDKNNASAHFGLAMALVNEGCLKKAEKSFRDALEFQPIFPEAQYFLGKTLVNIERLEEGNVHFDMAEKQGYYKNKVSYEKAKIFCKLGYHKDAIEALKTAKEYGFTFDRRLTSNPLFANLRKYKEFRDLYVEEN